MMSLVTVECVMEDGCSFLFFSGVGMLKCLTFALLTIFLMVWGDSWKMEKFLVYKSAFSLER